MMTCPRSWTDLDVSPLLEQIIKLPKEVEGGAKVQDIVRERNVLTDL